MAGEEHSQMDGAGGDPASASPPGKATALPGGGHHGVRLRVRLLLLIVLALLPSLALLIQSAIEERRVLATSIEEGMLRLVRPAASEMERQLGGTKQLLSVLARLPDIRLREVWELDPLFRDVVRQNPIYANIGAIAPDGTVFASALPFPKGLNLKDRPYFRRAVQARTFAIGDYQIGRITRKPTVNAAYPVLAKDGSVDSVVFAALDLSYFGRYASELSLPPGSEMTLLDRNGTVLTRYPENLRYLGEKMPETDVLAEILQRHYGVIEARGADGVQRIYAFAPIGHGEEQKAGAFVAVGITPAVAFARADAILVRNLGLLVLVWSMLLGIVWFGTERLVMSQVDNLMRATRKLAEGDLEARAGRPYSGDELGELARSFDNMAESLKTVTAQREEAVREEQAAQAEAQALKNLDRLRTQFVNAVSHELRIPLTSILGYTEFLEDELGGPLTGKQAEFVTQIHQGAIRLSRLVDDLLDYARIEAGTFALRVEPSDFGAKVSEIVESFMPQAEEAGLDLAATLPPEPMILPMDSHRVGQMLSNLIGNAIKFTPPGGRVSVSVRPEGPFIRCEVSDTGLGIAPEDLPKLFKPFSQLPAGKKMGGTGLGLSITKSLAEGHGGRVGVTSQPGKGSTFWFDLPRERPDRHSGPTESKMSTGRPPLSPVTKST